MKDWKEIAAKKSKQNMGFAQSSPTVMKSFMGVHGASIPDGALDEGTKELIALAIGVALRCEGCIALHAKRVAELGLTREKVVDALGVCLLMGGGPSLMYLTEALDAYDAFKA